MRTDYLRVLPMSWFNCIAYGSLKTFFWNLIDLRLCKAFTDSGGTSNSVFGGYRLETISVGSLSFYG